ncbi:imidazole glycerol phosphate synthase subunit HisH [Aggregatilineales bacterium SYSU G02658]
MLAVVDYGAGNLRSVMHALNHLHAPALKLVQHADDLKGASKIILPGVGAFGAGMQVLHERQLVEPIIEAVQAGTPFLGICVGMQFLFDYGEEMGEHRGLGLLGGRVVRFPAFSELKVPHTGWNQLQPTRPSPLLDGLPAQSFAYFNHSFHCVPERADDALITVEYGITFCAAVQRDHIFGVQFHPEKSQNTGLKILQNFINL